MAHIGGRLEQLLYRGGWPFRVARALGFSPEVLTTRHSIRVGGHAAAMPPLTIAYASDFHAGSTTDPAVLRAGCAQLAAAAPDVLLLGGDFVSLEPSAAESLAQDLAAIPAPFGRFAVLGNHDWWADAPRVGRILEASGIRLLTNRSVRLRPPFADVWICGLDDHWCGQPDAAAAVREAAGVRIVLMHSPSGLLDLGAERFDLALCGHTHGGQLALPGGVPIVLPHGPLSRRYARGRFALEDGRTLVVSVGLGCVVVPFRLFATPEIVVCTLTANSDDQVKT
jgi:uncharacterized protein